MYLTDIQQREVDDSADYFADLELSPVYLAVALAGEVGEVCNEIKKYERGDFDFVELTKRLHDELPDVLIYLVMLAGAMEINLSYAYNRKKEYNDRRFRTG